MLFETASPGNVVSSRDSSCYGDWRCSGGGDSVYAIHRQPHAISAIAGVGMSNDRPLSGDPVAEIPVIVQCWCAIRIDNRRKVNRSSKLGMFFSLYRNERSGGGNGCIHDFHEPD